ncbi:hypothetical protein [Polaromonas sp.]|uniref:hypothetical protein n=1 Tax=Polaromonas sp. TaxID=1869339 RepID=UPI003266387C
MVFVIGRWLKLSFAIALCALAGACASPASDLMKTDLRLVDEDSGLAVASIGYSLQSDDKVIALYMPASFVRLTIKAMIDSSAREVFISSADGRYVNEEQFRNGTVRRTQRDMRFVVAC